MRHGWLKTTCRFESTFVGIFTFQPQTKEYNRTKVPFLLWNRYIRKVVANTLRESMHTMPFVEVNYSFTERLWFIFEHQFVINMVIQFKIKTLS